MGFKSLCLFRIRLSGAKFTLVPPVKPDSLVDEDKEDVIEAVSFFCAVLLLLAMVALVHLIEKSCLVSVFLYFLFINYLSNGTKNVS